MTEYTEMKILDRFGEKGKYHPYLFRKFMDWSSWRSNPEFHIITMPIWVKRLIEASLNILTDRGEFEEVQNLPFLCRRACYRSLSIAYVPSATQTGDQERIDILSFLRDDGIVSGKFFSVRWDPIEIVRFDRGAWLYDLFV